MTDHVLLIFLISALTADAIMTWRWLKRSESWNSEIQAATREMLRHLEGKRGPSPEGEEKAKLHKPAADLREN